MTQARASEFAGALSAALRGVDLQTPCLIPTELTEGNYQLHINTEDDVINFEKAAEAMAEKIKRYGPKRFLKLKSVIEIPWVNSCHFAVSHKVIVRYVTAKDDFNAMLLGRFDLLFEVHKRTRR